MQAVYDPTIVRPSRGCNGRIRTVGQAFEKRPSANDPQVLWLRAGTSDTGLALTRLRFQITDATDRNTGAERDLVIHDLLQIGAIQNAPDLMPGERLNIGKINRSVTDGEITLAELRDAHEV